MGWVALTLIASGRPHHLQTTIPKETSRQAVTVPARRPPLRAGKSPSTGAQWEDLFGTCQTQLSRDLACSPSSRLHAINGFTVNGTVRNYLLVVQVRLYNESRALTSRQMSPAAVDAKVPPAHGALMVRASSAALYC
ncbi:hypothetical protein SUNI508_02818 [Seiridium unicorne]|uniref:Uncharacterized protein n=1 Tax=Seiridium unicorne TaxID=138068 RepID=A0ABR2VHF6_9PEZI